VISISCRARDAAAGGGVFFGAQLAFSFPPPGLDEVIAPGSLLQWRRRRVGAFSFSPPIMIGMSRGRPSLRVFSFLRRKPDEGRAFFFFLSFLPPPSRRTGRVLDHRLVVFSIGKEISSLPSFSSFFIAVKETIVRTGLRPLSSGDPRRVAEPARPFFSFFFLGDFLLSPSPLYRMNRRKKASPRVNPTDRFSRETPSLFFSSPPLLRMIHGRVIGRLFQAFLPFFSSFFPLFPPFVRKGKRRTRGFSVSFPLFPTYEKVTRRDLFFSSLPPLPDRESELALTNCSPGVVRSDNSGKAFPPPFLSPRPRI